jgi:hypothetical protein
MRKLTLLIVMLTTLLLRPVYANLPVTPAPSPLVVTSGEKAGEQPLQPFTLWLPVMRSK